MSDTVISCALVFSITAFIMALICLIEIRAMQKSTHRVQFYNPASQEFSAPLSEGQTETLRKEVFDNI